MKNSGLDLTKGSVLKVILAFAWPIMVSNIFQQLYNTTDTMIVGNFLGENALAAVGSTAAVFELIIGFTIGITNGMGIVIARYFGAKDDVMLKKSVAASITIGFMVALFFTVLGWSGLYPLLQILGTPDNIIHQAYHYIILILSGLLITVSYNLGAALLRAIGDSLTALYILVFSAVLNIGLDWLFVGPFQMGIKGASIATLIAQALSTVLCWTYIYQKRQLLIPKRNHFRIDKNLYRDMLGQGMSMGLMFSIVSIGTVILQTAINGLGVYIIGAQVTARRIQAFFIMPMTATASAMATFASQNFGARQYERIIKGIKRASLVVVIWAIFAFLFLAFAGKGLTILISGSNQTELLSASQLYIRLTTPFYPILGLLFVLRNSLQGLGFKRLPLISSFIELFGKIIFVVFIIPKLGYLGVILCEPLLWVPMAAQLYIAYRKKREYFKSYRA
ncbi:MATE family efflux transporter [Streptococcus sp. S784/96/1]|uniref:MATE family efflux transporter n=1 Tax=Streptococcus sp. S784/96/1 TaxID=2653499 RepID=UPI0013872393|nr:MATE family efflux transporter [Streptococcus sp. S784/96/1]